MATVLEIVIATCYLTLRLAMGLAFVGAVCRKGESRAWWLGFAVLGWVYLEAAFTPSEFAVPLPTEMLLGAIASSTFPSLARFAPRQPGLLDAIFSLWNCLWALLAAYFGGFLARAIFRTITGREEQPPSSPGFTERQSRARRGIRTSLLYFIGIGAGTPDRRRKHAPFPRGLGWVDVRSDLRGPRTACPASIVRRSRSENPLALRRRFGHQFADPFLRSLKS